MKLSDALVAPVAFDKEMSGGEKWKEGKHGAWVIRGAHRRSRMPENEGIEACLEEL